MLSGANLVRQLQKVFSQRGPRTRLRRPARYQMLLEQLELRIVPAGLVINPTFDSTITNDPNAATIEATINRAIAAYESFISDSITVNITFQEVTTGLGASNGVSYSVPYQTY
jgi:hypothetical protein